jgi:hypothetical protein
MRLDLGYKIVVRKFLVAQTQAKQLQFPTTMLTTKPTHLLLLLPRLAAAAAAALQYRALVICCGTEMKILVVG